ncbi:MAG TPA: DUF3788 domain-containing protein [Feifaniaceae bacterium]|nr:DUF3788 domain-containing protein [Feifaniaceae bacterium]
MDWSALYGPDAQPTKDMIRDYIGNPLWDTFHARMREAYGVLPAASYSKCSAQPGWNVKYQKSGKSLCTLYPVEGYFIALVVIGAKEEPEANLLMPHATRYVRELYEKTPFSCGGRWLMLHVTDEEILEDVLRLIALRRAAVKKKAV